MATRYRGTGFEFGVSGIGAKMGRLRGQFVSAQVEISAAHRRAAENLAATMVSVLEARIKETGRPQRETRYLVRALLDEGNTRYSADGFEAGIPSHLNKSQARSYWRNLERGSSVFVGRQIVGFFRTLEGKGIGPKRGRKDPRLIQLHPAIGQGGAQSTIRVGKSTSHIVDEGGKRITEDHFGIIEQGFSRVRTANDDFDIEAPRVSLGAKGGHYHSEVGGVGTRAAVAVRDSGRGYRTDRRPGRGDGGHFITIRNPIPAYEYMARGTQRWANSGDLERQYQRALIDFQKFLEFASRNNLTAEAARARLR